MLATFLASTPLLRESWRLCSSANAAAPGSFLTEGIGGGGGGVVYVAFSGIQTEVGSDPSWGHVAALESIGDLPLFSSHRNKEGEEGVKVHAGMLNLFYSKFKSFQNQVCVLLSSFYSLFASNSIND